MAHTHTRQAPYTSLITAARAGDLYAILDACDQEEVPTRAWEVGGRRAMSLYRGTAEEEYWDIAPYLFHIDRNLLKWIEQTLRHEPWGIFFRSESSLDRLRTHFRRFLKVKDPEDEEMLFRFYDPRVLPPFLESCNTEEIVAFYGPVTAYGVTTFATPSVDWITRA